MKNRNNIILLVVVILVIILIAWPSFKKEDNDTSNENSLATSTTDEMLSDLTATNTSSMVVENMMNNEVTIAGKTEDEMMTMENNAMTPAVAPSGMMAVKVFFGNTVNDPGTTNCSMVYPVTRMVAKTTSVGRVALTELLKGVTATEVTKGFATSLNTGITLQSLKIENGVATANFSEQLNTNVAGSCRVAAIRAQITETLKQFPSVKSVVIAVNSNSTTILQP